MRDNLALLRKELSTWPRRVSGYGLEHLLPENGFDVAKALVGSEGTCVTVLEATVALAELPRERVLAVLGFPSDIAAADAVPQILPWSPLTVEGVDAELVAMMPGRADDLPPGGAWLFVELAGENPAERARALAASLELTGSAVLDDPVAQRKLWRIREEGAGLATRLAGGAEAWPGWEDAAVPPERLGAYLREFKDLMRAHGRKSVVYGHYGEGCLHLRLDFDLLSPSGIAGFRRFLEEAADLVAAHGGSLSGEHGDGQARSELLARMYSPEMMDLFARFKAIFDPAGRMNPGILVAPRAVDADLRVRPAPLSIEDVTVLGYPEDRGSFGQAMRRCVGVGKCRNTSGGGVMCPSYRATREEQHSTRGRAHLLAEMINGEVITDGWRSTEVHDALDLCLSCKGCLSDCPVDVDMATYKAEFLHQHYRRRLRPASHYSMGWLPLWLRFSALTPRLANAVGRSPRLSGLLKRLGGIAPERALPDLRASAVHPVASGSAAAGFRRAESRAVAGFLQQLPDAFGARRGPRSPDRGGLRRRPAGPRCLLWTDVGVDRPARRRAPGAGAHAFRAGALPGRGLRGRRAGAELHGAVPRRPARAAAGGRPRGTAGVPDVHVRGAAGARADPVRGPRRRHDHAGALPPARGAGLRRRRGRDGFGGHPQHDVGLGLLRPGRQLRLRARPLRRVEGGGGGPDAPGDPGGCTGDARACPTASAAARRSRRSPAGKRCTWPNSCAARCLSRPKGGSPRPGR